METPTQPAGCQSNVRYEEQGCTFLETDDPRDCDMITTETLTITAEVGCCLL